MRKTILTILALIVMSAQCVAADWVWLHSDENEGFFFDKGSIVFDISKDRKIVNRDRFYVWVKTAYDAAFAKKEFGRDDVAYSVDRFGFDAKTNSVCEKHILYYNHNKQVIYQQKDILRWQTIVPETLGESLFRHISKFVREHEAEIEQRTRGNR
jgi:hypothetical protein